MALLLATGSAFAQSLPAANISIERLYQYPLINGRSSSSPEMAPNGSKIVFGWNQTGARKLYLWATDFPSGQKHQLVSSGRIAEFPRQDDSRSVQEKTEQALYDGGISGANWSPDSRELMFSFKGRTWLVKPDGSSLHPLINGQTVIGTPNFSPDGKYISYSNGQNVFRFERSTGAVKQLTFLSKANTSIQGETWSPMESKSQSFGPILPRQVLM